LWVMVAIEINSKFQLKMHRFARSPIYN